MRDRKCNLIRFLVSFYCTGKGALFSIGLCCRQPNNNDNNNNNSNNDDDNNNNNNNKILPLGLKTQ